MIVVDTSVWISHFRNVLTPQVLFLRAIELPRQIIVGDAILLEILQGAESERHARLVEMKLRELYILPMLDERIAAAAAKNYRMLRAKGITIRKTIDLVIGTFCIEHGHMLLHQDRDFSPMSEHLGLQIVPT